MAAVREYIFGITAAAIISAITLCFAEKGPMEPLLKLICGLVLTFCLVEPILNLSAGNWEALGIDFQEEAKKASEEGILQSETTVRSIIKQETEAYILDKANKLHLSLEVAITLSDQAMPVPESVVLRGTATPYGKSCLSRILTEELGIQKENQKWIS